MYLFLCRNILIEASDKTPTDKKRCASVFMNLDKLVCKIDVFFLFPIHA